MRSLCAVHARFDGVAIEQEDKDGAAWEVLEECIFRKEVWFSMTLLHRTAIGTPRNTFHVISWAHPIHSPLNVTGAHCGVCIVCKLAKVLRIYPQKTRPVLPFPGNMR